MYSARRTAVLPAVGFPIRVSTDHRLFSASSWLIAAVHALHRLLVPRHPPCALDILTVIFLDFCSPPEARKPAGGPRTQPLRKGAVPTCHAQKRRPARSAVVAVTSVCWMTVQFSRSAENERRPGFGRRSLKTQQHAGAATFTRAAPRQIRSTSSDSPRPALRNGSASKKPRQALHSWSSLERR